MDQNSVKKAPPWDYYARKLFPEWQTGANYYGTWSRHRLLFHLTFYEANMALPTMRMWKGGALAKFDGIPSEDGNYDQELGVHGLIAQFKQVRENQISFLQSYSDDLLDQVKMTEWGEKSLEWVVMKTIQHAYEHANKMLRHVLFGPDQRENFIKIARRFIKEGKPIDMEALEELENLD
jgi:hypothetical protein